MTEYIKTDKKGKILTINLNRPEQKNALSLNMYKAITSLLIEAEEDSGINAVVLRGTEECFTSGNDLNDFISNLPASKDNPILIFLHTVHRFKKPLIAAVGGDAVGIGTTVLFHCDTVVASENARFRMPFVNLGLIPEAGSTYMLPDAIGHRNAFQLLVTGDVFDSETAKQAGLVNFIAPAGKLLETAHKEAEKIAALPPSAVMSAKMLMKKNYMEEVAERIDLEAELFIKHLKTEEAQNAIMAFLSKGQM